MDQINTSTNRSFGIVFFIVFFLIALYPLLNGENIRIWSLTISFNFLVLGIFNSKILSPFNKIWFKFGMLLGSIIAPIVMAMVYLTTVLPTGLIMRLLGKDLLRKSFDKNANSYWIERNIPMGSMKNQF